MNGIATVLAVCAAGGIGAVLRFVLDGLVRGRTDASYPWGTTVINLSGSLVLGFVTGLGVAHLLPPAVQLAVGTGLLGGYTTFSTASFETVRLLEERRIGAAAANGLGQVLVATGAAAAGYAVALLIAP